MKGVVLLAAPVDSFDVEGVVIFAMFGEGVAQS